MRKTTFPLGLFVIFFLCGSGATDTSAQTPDPLVGTWTGALEVGAGAKLRVVFNITVDTAGQRKVTMDSPDQGVKGIPVASAELKDGAVTISAPAVAGSYTGRMAADGKSIEGTWTQGPSSLPLRLEKAAGPVAGPARPQEPKEPFPYRVEEVTFANADAPGVTLSGTLTLPPSGEPFSAVVFVSGSGPQNRNEELLGHKPFLVLADYLTRRGVAVLRYDDRGVGKSTGSFATATSVDFAGDALAGVGYLRSRREIDPGKVGVLGHSEGGLIAPMAAARSKDVAFIVMLAGPGVSGEEILYLQGELIARANGATAEQLTRTRQSQERTFAILREAPDTARARQDVEALAMEQLAALTPEERKAGGLPDGVADSVVARQQAAQVSSPWFRYFLTYDPKPALRQVEVPVLAINGSLDLQVPPGQNLPMIRKALEEGGNPDATVLELAGLNHLFQEATTGAPSEYARIEQTMSPTALETVGDWIVRRFGPSR